MKLDREKVDIHHGGGREWIVTLIEGSKYVDSKN